jgi:DNA-binding MarR family transcriptional regulator
MNPKTAAPSREPSSWPLLLTAHAVLTGMVEKQLSDADLPALGWYDVLWALDRAPGQRLRMHELAHYIVLSRSNMTRLVDRLETAGLIRRESDPDDRRGAFAVLTEQGAAMRKKMWPKYEAAIASLYDAHLSADEQRVLGSALRKVLDGARAASR